MVDYQRIVILGNTTADVEVKQSESGTQYAHLSVAVSKGREETIFFPVTLFQRNAEIAGEILPKGSRVLVEGTLDVDAKTGKFKVLGNTFCKA